MHVYEGCGGLLGVFAVSFASFFCSVSFLFFSQYSVVRTKHVIVHVHVCINS